MAIRYTILFLLFANIGFAQTYSPITGKQDFKDSLKFSKFGNNATEDSILTVDKTTKKLKFILGGTGTQTTINNYLGIDSLTTRLLTGSVVNTVGFTLQNTALTYLILGRKYAAAGSTFTITGSDLTLDRFTVVWADTLGNVGYTNSALSSNPQIPSVDPKSQCPVATYFIPHGATSPANISSLVIYKENVEWVLSGTATGLDGGYATNPYAGLVSTRVPAIISGQSIDYTYSSTLTASDFGYLYFYIRLGAAFNSSTNLIFSFKNSGSAVSTTLALSNGNYGYNSALVGSYQLVAIPMSAFGFTGVFNRLHIDLTGANASGFQIDNIILQAGGIVSGGTGVIAFNNRNGYVLPIRTDYKWYHDSMSINYDGTRIINWNNGVALEDSTKYNNGPDTLMVDKGLYAYQKSISGSRYDTLKRLDFAGIGMTITDSAITRDGKTVYGKVFNSTASGGGGADSLAYRTRTIAPDSSYFTLNRLNGIKDTFRFTGATAGGGTTYTGTSPINVTGSVISLNTVPIANGGTNATTANAAFNNLVPTQISNTGKYLTTDGTNTSWSTVAAGGVTSAFARTGAVVAATGDYNYSKITRNKQVHTSGATVTVGSATDWLIVKPTLAALTITLEASPVDGQRVDISFKLAVTSLTVSPNTGQTIKDANGITFVDAGESIAYQYDSTDLIWYRL